jgi:oligosaccharyltransferase complex subunit alpha (ribophorin I)
MSLRWLYLPFFALNLALPVFSTSSQSFENNDIVRNIDLGGSTVQVTTTYTIKSLEDGSQLYTIALSPEDKRKTGWIQAKIKGAQKPLVLEDLGYDEDRYSHSSPQPHLVNHLVSLSSQSHLLEVALSTPLGINATTKLVLETVQTHATRPWPEMAGQDDDQALKYETSLFVVSPYYTAVQRTKIRYFSLVRSVNSCFHVVH